MPANLTPQYLEAEAKFRAAETTEEKLEALDEMMAVIPKHKGTEKMRADIKRRIAKLRQKDKSAGSAKKGLEYNIQKEGAGQVVIAGPPNSGKSLIVRRMTAAEPEVADYPFTTRHPVSGMMEYEDILVQLVDTPPISEDMTEPWVIAISRAAEAVAIVLDLAGGTILDDIENVKSELIRGKVRLIAPGQDPPVGEYPAGTVFRPAIIVANKLDQPGAEESLAVFHELYNSELPVIPVSALTGEGLEDLKRQLFELLGIVRVYTKIPGKPPDYNRPFVLKKGSTVADLAASVHKEFVYKLRFARAWGKGKPDGMMAGRDQELEDKDIIELHV
ncbi:MAG: GTPase [Armatimonadota bacterium]